MTIDSRRLRVRRAAADLTQQEVADRAGLHRTTVAALESARRWTHLGTVEAVARAVDCEPTYLLSPEDRARLTALGYRN